jgi:hypothetical protein
MRPKTKPPDLSVLGTEELIALIRDALREALSRGPNVEELLRAATLDETERLRIASAAAAAEARRLKEEAARRVAEEAAAKVRREAAQKQADSVAATAAKVRAVAVRARELFGSDVECFSVRLWEKPGDKRVYVGGGYGSNWVEYYHTGNGRTAPGTISTHYGVVKALAEHRGVTWQEAEGLIRDFCRDVCERWNSLHCEVNGSNAPRDPAAVDRGFVVKPKDEGWYYTTRCVRRAAAYTHDADEADLFATAEDGLAVVRGLVEGGRLSHDWDGAEAVPAVRWRAFPPKQTREAPDASGL